tara:strand:+ start:4965 stop:5243 length:279 start_codon:yes stop_codon:yes gene_type:complete
MAKIIVTVKIMPMTPEVDLNQVEKESKLVISNFAGEGETKTEEELIGFGLKALNIIFVIDEEKGSPDPVAEKISEIDGVNSAEIVDVRRALG